MASIEPARGRVSAITDPAARGEVNSLWTLLEGRLGYGKQGTTGTTLVTQAQLTKALQATATKTTVQVPYSPGVTSSSPATTGGAGTPPILYAYATLQAAAAMQFQSLNDTTITIGTKQGSAATVTQPINGNYVTVVDIEKSTTAAAALASGGVTSCLQIQHIIDGITTVGGAEMAAVYAVIETTQVGPVGSNNAIAGWFVSNNLATNCVGLAVYGASFVNGTSGNNAAWGGCFDVGKSGVGATVQTSVAVHARSSYYSPYTLQNDFAFLASTFPTGSGGTWGSLFAGGSPEYGNVTCGFGLNLSYATCEFAAILIGPLQSIAFQYGTTKDSTMYVDAQGNFNFLVNGVEVAQFTAAGSGGLVCNGLAINGTVFCGDLNTPAAQLGALSASSFTLSAPTVASVAGGIIGYVVMNIGGSNKHVPFYA